MNHLDGKRKDILIPLIMDIVVILLSVGAPIYSAVRGGLSPNMLGQLQYFYLLIAAILLILLLRDVITSHREAKKAGKLLYGGRYQPSVMQDQMVYRCLFLIVFIFLLIFRPKAGALCVLLSAAALYFILDMQLILMMHAPGVYENGVYFFGTFYSWDKIRSYNIREAHRNIKFNVSNEQKKLFSTGDVVIIMDDVNQTQPVLKQHVSLKD